MSFDVSLSHLIDDNATVDFDKSVQTYSRKLRSFWEYVVKLYSSALDSVILVLGMIEMSNLLSCMGLRLCLCMGNHFIVLSERGLGRCASNAF